MAITGTGGRNSNISNALLRIFGVVVLIPALILMATDEQTIRVSGFVLKAKFGYAKAFEVFVAATAVCIAYLLLSAVAVLLFFRPAEGVHARNLEHRAWILFMADQLLTYFLLGATAASTEVAYIAKEGSDKVGWNAVCGRFDRFCNHAAAALALSYVGVIVLSICTVMSVKRLVINHKTT